MNTNKPQIFAGPVRFKEKVEFLNDVEFYGDVSAMGKTYMGDIQPIERLVYRTKVLKTRLDLIKAFFTIGDDQ